MFVALAALAGGAAACSSKPPRFETPAEALTRRLGTARGAMPAPGDEPGSYTIRFDRFTRETGEHSEDNHDVVGSGATKRRALNPERLVRVVHRPFNATLKPGGAGRRLGFVNDRPRGEPRVVLLRPLPDDPRPRIYPLPDDKDRTVYTVARRKCTLHTDGKGRYCIDSAGLVLASEVDGTADVATSVRTAPSATRATAIAAALAKGFINKDAGSLRPIAPKSSPPGQPDISLSAPPAGFTHVGRYTVVALSKAVLERTSRKVAAGIADVYVRGADAIVIDRGGRLDKSDVTDEDLGGMTDATTIDLGPFGPARAGIGGIGPFGYREVRFAPSKGRYVVVAGTVPLDELIALTRSLTTSPGTQLVYTDK
ncbi:MAG: hypothetical protein QOF21_2296 [Actinomycetota bacterium]|jgi:hypothetical protein